MSVRNPKRKNTLLNPGSARLSSARLSPVRARARTLSKLSQGAMTQNDPVLARRQPGSINYETCSSLHLPPRQVGSFLRSRSLTGTQQGLGSTRPGSEGGRGPCPPHEIPASYKHVVNTPQDYSFARGKLSSRYMAGAGNRRGVRSERPRAWTGGRIHAYTVKNIVPLYQKCCENDVQNSNVVGW